MDCLDLWNVQPQPKVLFIKNCHMSGVSVDILNLSLKSDFHLCLWVQWAISAHGDGPIGKVDVWICGLTKITLIR